MEPEITPPSAVIVEIAAKRAPIATVAGAVDAALASEIAELSVRVELAEGDPRRSVFEELYGADSRVAIADPGAPVPASEIVFTMPANARPSPRTLPQVAALIRSENLGSAEAPVPGRFGSLLGARGKLRATAGGSGAKRLPAADLDLRSTTTRGQPGPPPQGTLAEERAEHLRHRARSSTMRARMDRNAHRLSRERLQVRHERARLRLAEQRVGKTGAGEWVRWRSRAAGRRAAALPALASSGARSVRVFGRRARRLALDRWRSRGSEPA
jgi:hypothetical protein